MIPWTYLLDPHDHLADDRPVGSLDYRTRPARRVRTIDPAEFCRSEWPKRLRETGGLAGPAAARANLPPLTVEIADTTWTFVPERDTISIVEGPIDPALAVSMDADAFAALVDDHKSTLGLAIAGRAAVTEGDGAHFIGWDPILRAALDGRPVFEPGSITLEDPKGAPLDLHRRFQPSDDPATLRAFLQTAGFLCIEHVFTQDEMQRVADDLDRALDQATPDDGTSWWVRTAAGEHRPSRILNFLAQSDHLQALVKDPRFLALGAIAGEGHVHSDSFGEHFAEPSAEGLIKPVGVKEGVSDLGWHKDCARGGHSRFCCGLTIGIAITGADEDSGELRVVAGSHRTNLPPAGLTEDVDLPVVALPTKAGDVTIHCSCTLHEARPPELRERKVVYTGFGLPPKFEDDAPPPAGTVLASERATIGRLR